MLPIVCNMNFIFMVLIVVSVWFVILGYSLLMKLLKVTDFTNEKSTWVYEAFYKRALPVAVIEELVFRYLFYFVCVYLIGMNIVLAVLLNGIIFSSWHFVHIKIGRFDWKNIHADLPLKRKVFQWIGLFVFTMILSILYFKTGFLNLLFHALSIWAVEITGIKFKEEAPNKWLYYNNWHRLIGCVPIIVILIIYAVLFVII